MWSLCNHNGIYVWCDMQVSVMMVNTWVDRVESALHFLFHFLSFTCLTSCILPDQHPAYEHPLPPFPGLIAILLKYPWQLSAGTEPSQRCKTAPSRGWMTCQVLQQLEQNQTAGSQSTIFIRSIPLPVTHCYIYGIYRLSQQAKLGCYADQPHS